MDQRQTAGIFETPGCRVSAAEGDPVGIQFRFQVFRVTFRIKNFQTGLIAELLKFKCMVVVAEGKPDLGQSFACERKDFSRFSISGRIVVFPGQPWADDVFRAQDFMVFNNRISFIDEPLYRNVCGEDEKTFVIQNLFQFFCFHLAQAGLDRLITNFPNFWQNLYKIFGSFQKVL